MRLSSPTGPEANLLEPNTRVEPIQTLIPIGPEAANELLRQEVCWLTGEHYKRESGVPGYARWGGQRGSVHLADQKLAIAVPRVRDRRRGQQVTLSAYRALQDPRRTEDASVLPQGAFDGYNSAMARPEALRRRSAGRDYRTFPTSAGAKRGPY